MELILIIIIGASLLYVGFGMLAALVHLWDGNNAIFCFITWFCMIVVPYLIIIIMTGTFMVPKPIRLIVAIVFAYISYLYGYSLYHPVK